MVDRRAENNNQKPGKYQRNVRETSHCLPKKNTWLIGLLFQNMTRRSRAQPKRFPEAQTARDFQTTSGYKSSYFQFCQNRQLENVSTPIVYSSEAHFFHSFPKGLFRYLLLKIVEKRKSAVFHEKLAKKLFKTYFPAVELHQLLYICSNLIHYATEKHICRLCHLRIRQQ